MSFLSVLLLVFCAITVNHVEALRTAIACEHSRGVRIACRPHHFIHIQYAMYGRLRRNVCAHVNVPNRRCVSRLSLIRTKSRCQGKQSCHLLASNTIYGDPCWGVQKYLEVRYRCVARGIKSYACEHKKGKTISCGKKVINIKYAMYGRLERNVCAHVNVPNRRCVSRVSLVRTRARCQGKHSCHLLAHNAIYGDPCRGVVKYLEVIHTCVPKPFNVAYACEHTRGRVIGCPAHEVLNILYAMYGRLQRKICAHVNVPNRRCVSPVSLARTRARCQGKRSCHLSAHNGIYGDPCWGVLKYLEVRYKCVPNPRPIVVFACEHTNGRVISCPGHKRIRIKYAMYGRLRRNVCAHVNVPRRRCVSRLSLSRTKARCEGKKSCHLSAHNGIYGDPCSGVVKYLEVHYRCY